METIKSTKAFSKKYGIELIYDILSDGDEFFVRRDPFIDKELAETLGVLKAYKKADKACEEIRVFSSLTDAEAMVNNDIFKIAV